MPRLTPSNIRVQRLHPALGAEVTGLDLTAPLDSATREAVLDAWMEHQVLVFPDQPVSDAEHVAFSRHFGDLEIFPQRVNRSHTLQEIFRVANTDEDGRLLPPTSDTVRYLALVEYWHTDSCYRPIPSTGAILHGIEVTRRGGETWFANLYLAYEALPEAMKRRLLTMKAVHSFEYSRSLEDLPPMDEAERRSVPPVSHPLIRVHPVTGRKSLYISAPYMERFEGLSAEASRALVDELVAHATQPGFVYRHRWRPHDVVMWDNRCTMHAVTPFDTATERRVMHRTAIAGDGPVIAATAI